MTPLEAMKQAQETGQIAITKNTAKFLASFIQMEEHYNDAVEAMTAGFDGKTQDDLARDMHEHYRTFCEAFVKEFYYNVVVEAFGWKEFKGL